MRGFGRLWFVIAAGAALLCLGSACRRDVPAAADSSPDVEHADSLPSPAPGAPLPTLAATTDGRTALERASQAYRTLRSYQCASVADVKLRSGRSSSQYRQQSLLRFRREPDQIMLLVRDTGSGTTAFYADGATLTQFSGLNNAYVRGDLTGSLASLSRGIEYYGPQVLSPIMFLQPALVRAGTASVRYDGPDTVEGKPTIRVRGKFTAPYLARLGSITPYAAGLKPGRSEFTLWLDAGTYVVRKSRFQASWIGTTRDARSLETYTNPTIEATERVVEGIPNPALAAGLFRFVPPAGAQQRFLERPQR